MIRIPTETTADELVFLAIPQRAAAPEHLQAILYQLCRIVAKQQEEIEALEDLLNDEEEGKADPTDEPPRKAATELRSILGYGLEAAKDVDVGPLMEGDFDRALELLAELAAEIDPPWPTEEQMAEAWVKFQKMHGALGVVASGTYSGEGATVDIEEPRFGGQWGSTIGSVMEEFIGKDDEPKGGVACQAADSLAALLILVERHESVTIHQEFSGSGDIIEGAYEVLLGDDEEPWVRGSAQEIADMLAEAKGGDA